MVIFCNDFYILSTKPKVWLDHRWDLRIFQMDFSGQALETGWRMLNFLGENQNVNLGRNVNPESFIAIISDNQTSLIIINGS